MKTTKQHPSTPYQNTINNTLSFSIDDLRDIHIKYASFKKNILNLNDLLSNRPLSNILLQEIKIIVNEMSIKILKI